ncbi:MAG: acyloxyacyl hydrolase [Salinivirgaceae bacterium]
MVRESSYLEFLKNHKLIVKIEKQERMSGVCIMIWAKHIFATLAFLIICMQFTHAQDSISVKDRLYLKLEGLAGNSYAHHDAINYLLQYPPYGLGLQVGLYSSGLKSWENDLKMPHYGMGFQASQLGSSYLGNAYAMYLYVGSSFLQKQRWKWCYDIGAGIGYVDNPYNPESNPLNIVNGSAWNAFLRVSTGIAYRFAPKHEASFNGGLFHLSNGNSALPNWGVNTLYYSLGYNYKITDVQTQSQSLKIKEKNTRITLYGGAGFKESPPIDGVKFLVADMHVNAWHTFRPAHAWGGGISMFYDRSAIKILSGRKFDYLPPLDDFEMKTGDYYSLGAQAGYMLNMHPVYFSFEFGVYIISPTGKDVYNRWLLEIQLTERTRIVGGLTSRFGKADYISYGLGYDLFKIQNQ